MSIRSPRCFSHGRSIASLSHSRLGMSTVFNIARLWTALASGEGLVAGPACFNPFATKSYATRCSLVCHDSRAHNKDISDIDLVITSSQNVWEAVCTRKLSDLWCRETGGLGKEQAQDFTRRCRVDEELSKAEAVRQCRSLMYQQAEIYYQRQRDKKPVVFDLSLDEYSRDPISQISRVGKAMGVCTSAAENTALLQFVDMNVKQLQVRPAPEVSMTRLHDLQPNSAKMTAACTGLDKWLQSDEHCAAWVESNSSAASNLYLRQMTKFGGLDGITDNVKKQPTLRVTGAAENGKYFLFNADKGDSFFGSSSWDKRVFVVRSKGASSLLVVVFRESKLCGDTSCGRLYPSSLAEPNDWFQGDLIYLDLQTPTIDVCGVSDTTTAHSRWRQTSEDMPGDFQ